jgi:hypothetical protein
MSKALQEAIEQLRELPEEDQDAAAAAIFAYIFNDNRDEHLSVDERLSAS